MDYQINFTQISISAVKYDKKTGLFPFSPRKAIDHDHVLRLLLSIQETGIWQPIVVRKSNMEGLVGNHRYLAMIAYYQKLGMDLNEAMIPVAIVDCSEGEAVMIALIENEFRQDLTQLELVQAVQKSVKRIPAMAEKVLRVNRETSKQMSFWIDQLEPDYYREINERKSDLLNTLDMRWVETINTRLADYPQLHNWFMEQLRFPAWVKARTLEELNQEISTILLGQGVRFEPGRTWNSQPSKKCLKNCSLSYNEIEGRLLNNYEEDIVNEYGEGNQLCPYLRLSSRKVTQFIPRENGHEVISVERISNLPEHVLSENKKLSKGVESEVTWRIEAFCVDPNLSRPGSCFRQIENEERNKLLSACKEEGIHALTNVEINKRKVDGAFVWESPQYQGQACNAINCRFRFAKEPAFAFTLFPSSNVDQMKKERDLGLMKYKARESWQKKQAKKGVSLQLLTEECQQIICLNEFCGKPARKELIDWEKIKIKQEKEAEEKALNDWRRKTVEATLFSALEPDFNSPEMLELLEKLLVPEWDEQTMEHVVVGYCLVENDTEELAQLPTVKAFNELKKEFAGEKAKKAIWLSLLVSVLEGPHNFIGT